MEGFFNYVVIEDGVVVGIGSGSGGGSTVEIRRNGSLQGIASGLDYVGTGIKITGPASGVLGLNYPEISPEILNVHPDFIDDSDFSQYSTVEAAITRAKALRGAGKFILIKVQAAIYQPTVQWDVHDGYGLEFDPGCSFDFSLWVGGSTFVQVAGYTYLKGFPAIFGVFGSHPFTNGKCIEALRVDPVTSTISLVLVDGAFIWDGQGGATTYGVHLTPGGGALAARPNLLFSNSICSIASGVGSVVVEGDWGFNSGGGLTKIACVFAPAVKQIDSGTDYPQVDLDVSHLQAFGPPTAYDFEKSPNGTVAMNGSILVLKNTNMDWLTDLAGISDGPVSEENVLQFSYPDPAKPVSERYSLEAALALIKKDISNITSGHNHDGTDSRKVNFSDLNNAFGHEYDSAESDGESTTTLTAFQQKLLLTTGSLPVGTYRIGFYCEVKSDGGNSDGAEAQVDLDAGTIIGFAESLNASPGAGLAAGHWLPLSGHKEVTFGSATTHTLEIDYLQTGVNTARVRRARIEIWRVA